MKYKRLVVCLLFMVGIISCVPSLADAPKALSVIGYDNDGSERDWTQSRFFTRMEAATGVATAPQQYRDPDAYDAAKSEALEGMGTLPDIFFKAHLTPQEEMEYLASGKLVDLAPYLAEHAPNLSKILASRPDWLTIIQQPNGAIASLPVLNGAERQCGIWINQSWLNTLGLTMPKDVEEYTEVLKAFRDKDPNGNGKKDEIPLSLLGPWEAKFLLHAWGLTPNDYNIYADDQNAVRFSPFEPGFRSFVEWLHMALSESLIDKDAFRQSQNARGTALSVDTDAPNIIGGMVSIAPYTLIAMEKTSDYSAVPPFAFGGKQVYRRLLTGVGRGAFAVTSACEDIPAALRWVDYLYSEEGGRMAFAGLKDEDYTVMEDGSWKWSSGENYTALSEIAASSIIAGDGQAPGLEPAAFMRNSEITADNHARRQTDMLRDFLVDPMPVIWPTDVVREARIEELQAALGPCVDTAIANFAMGILPLDDEHWNAFLAELRGLSAEEFIGLWQEKLDEQMG